MNHKVMEKAAHRAYMVWTQQRQRCYNPKCRTYQWYGHRGIEVEYDAREFVGWYLFQLEKNPKIKQPSVGRIDHSHNYRIDNIEMVEASDNTREVNQRLGYAGKRFVKVMAIINGKTRLYFDSIGQAARVCGVNRFLLEQHLSGKMESPITQFVFRYK